MPGRGCHAGHAVSAQVTQGLGDRESPEHCRENAATDEEAANADQHASDAATRLPHPHAEVGRESPSDAAVQPNTAGADRTSCALLVSASHQPQTVPPQCMQQTTRPGASAGGSAGCQASAPPMLPQPGSPGGAAEPPANSTQQRSAVAGPAAMPRSRADGVGGCDDDADEVLSQRPLAEIRQQMLASQPKRSTQQRRDNFTPRPDQQQPSKQRVDCSLLDSSPGEHLQLSQVPLAVRVSSLLAPTASGNRQLPHQHTQRLQGRLSGQPSQLPLASRAAPTQRRDGLDTDLAGGDDVQLSQIPLAKWATNAPGTGGSQARRMEAQQQSRSATGTPTTGAAAAYRTADMAQRGSVRAAAPTQADAALHAQARGRFQSWSASAVRLREQQQQQQTPPPRWSNSGDQEDDPLEDLTLHQRQWAASGQHRLAGCKSSQPNALAVATTALKVEATTVQNPRGEDASPVLCPDSAASELLGSARAAAAAVVARVERQAAEAVKELERKISDIASRVPGQAQSPGAARVPDPALQQPASGSAPAIEPRPAQPAPESAAPMPGEAWLPAPDPSPEARSTPRDAQQRQQREREEQTARHRLGAGGTGVIEAPPPEAAEDTGNAGLEAGALAAAEASRGCMQAVQGSGQLRPQQASMQTPRDPVSWSGASPHDGVATQL